MSPKEIARYATVPNRGGKTSQASDDMVLTPRNLWGGTGGVIYYFFPTIHRLFKDFYHSVSGQKWGELNLLMFSAGVAAGCSRAMSYRFLEFLSEYCLFSDGGSWAGMVQKPRLARLMELDG